MQRIIIETYLFIKTKTKQLTPVGTNKSFLKQKTNELRNKLNKKL